MSIYGKREYRPKLHFTPPSMWLNDPNGLFFDRDEYHMFYQYNPFDTDWGPMHWGHTVSSDLVHWKELPMALYPDKSGAAFSGCAVIDKQNTSGLSAHGDAAVLIYTRDCAEGQKQYLDYSYDKINFYHYSQNPIIRNPGIKDFRDPKVFWYPGTERWIMVVAVKTELWFYHSPNLLNWEFLSQFQDKTLGNSICFECPDIYPLKAPDESIHWVLTSSIIFLDSSDYRVISYIGMFDGNSFTAYGSSQVIDYGQDYYAAASFWGVKDHTTIGWFSNWNYAARFPTGNYCGIMSLPRTPILNKREGCFFLANQIHPFIKRCFGPASEILHRINLTSETFYLDIRCTENFSIKLENKKQEFLKFGLIDGQYYIDRSCSGRPSSNPWPPVDKMQRRTAPRSLEGSAHMELIFDCCCCELFCDDGCTNFSMACFPTIPYSQLEVEGDGKATISLLLEYIDNFDSFLVE